MNDDDLLADPFAIGDDDDDDAPPPCRSWHIPPPDSNVDDNPRTRCKKQVLNKRREMHYSGNTGRSNSQI